MVLTFDFAAIWLFRAIPRYKRTSPDVLGQRIHGQRNRMRQSRTYGSVGALDGQPPGLTRPPAQLDGGLLKDGSQELQVPKAIRAPGAVNRQGSCCTSAHDHIGFGRRQLTAAGLSRVGATGSRVFGQLHPIRSNPERS